MVEVLYFAWVRERIGESRESVETGAATVAGLVDELRAREQRYALAFEDLSALRSRLVDLEAERGKRRVAGARKGALERDGVAVGARAATEVPDHRRRSEQGPRRES